MLEITEAAADVLTRAYDAAARFNPQARIRVFKRADSIDTEFVESPQERDEIIEHQGMTILVEDGIGDGVLDVTDQHDRLILRAT